MQGASRRRRSMQTVCLWGTPMTGNLRETNEKDSAIETVSKHTYSHGRRCRWDLLSDRMTSRSRISKLGVQRKRHAPGNKMAVKHPFGLGWKSGRRVIKASKSGVYVSRVGRTGIRRAEVARRRKTELGRYVNEKCNRTSKLLLIGIN